MQLWGKWYAADVVRQLPSAEDTHGNDTLDSASISGASARGRRPARRAPRTADDFDVYGWLRACGLPCGLRACSLPKTLPEVRSVEASQALEALSSQVCMCLMSLDMCRRSPRMVLLMQGTRSNGLLASCRRWLHGGALPMSLGFPSAEALRELELGGDSRIPSGER